LESNFAVRKLTKFRNLKQHNINKNMKRAIVMSVLGAATCLVANRVAAQGTITFANYTGGGATAPVTFAGAAFGGFTAGETIGSGFTAELLYSSTGVTYNSTGSTTAFIAPSGTAPSAGGGLFGGLAVSATVPGYVSGNAWFEVQVYNGANYGASTIKGTSAAFELSAVATALNALPVGDFFDARAVTPISAFTVAAVPEPATMALGGLGLASLLLFRRKQV
jgi:hypothetical protein